jgi:V-type H+-transporting ATPase subunit B
MKAVVGEEALSPDDMQYLRFTERFERKFLSQGPYQTHDIFESLEAAWELLRYFPPDQLKKIPAEIRDEFWPRKAGAPAPKGEEKEE